jgi:hypothetical protein
MNSIASSPGTRAGVRPSLSERAVAAVLGLTTDPTGTNAGWDEDRGDR